ncbi:hypothetical protein A3F65_02375 [Candidatus Saccharibacteria bacterium RIFCSPHIGHO2_12_FULL_47_16b]|nr:MAG: hypothetical protein A3F65_02375 [Candidatus Saccharibacteria bacterium RIFCSPHIGHO2_12_FULL_47_16b]
MSAGEIIGLDVGQVRTGLARASSMAKLAEPLTTIPTDQLTSRLKKLANQGTSQIVVGLPRNLAGGDTAQTRWLRQWIKSAKAIIPEVKFYLQDEALTSLEARSKKLESSKHVDEHAVAAALILQDWLDQSDRRRQVA